MSKIFSLDSSEVIDMKEKIKNSSLFLKGSNTWPTSLLNRM